MRPKGPHGGGGSGGSTDAPVACRLGVHGAVRNFHSMSTPVWVAVPVCAIGILAAREDLRTRRIPNLLTGPALLLGIGAHLLQGGTQAGLSALGACLVAGALLFPGWLLKFMGAGDVKLMAAIGAWLGSAEVSLYAVLFSLVVGGVISMVVAVRRGILLQTLRNAALLLPRTAAGTRKDGPPPATSGVYVPKAIAFLVGSLFALWWPL